MFPRRKSKILTALAVGTLLTLTVACSGDGRSPTDPGMPDTMSLTGASVEVDGQRYEAGASGTYHQDHGGRALGSTLFQARLIRDGVPITGQTVRVAYEMPMGHGMMGRASGHFPLYDDGTHGDPTPGDGIYCYEDHVGQHGFHHPGAGHGNYHYDFFGLHPDGMETNHMTIDVVVQD